MFAAPNICSMNSGRLQFSMNLLCLCCHSINCFLVSSLTKLQKLDLTFLLICKAPTALTSAPLLFRQGNVTFSLNISIATLCALHAVHLISSAACYNFHHSIWFDLLCTSHVTSFTMLFPIRMTFEQRIWKFEWFTISWGLFQLADRAFVTYQNTFVQEPIQWSLHLH